MWQRLLWLFLLPFPLIGGLPVLRLNIVRLVWETSISRAIVVTPRGAAVLEAASGMRLVGTRRAFVIDGFTCTSSPRGETAVAEAKYCGMGGDERVPRVKDELWIEGFAGDLYQVWQYVAFKQPRGLRNIGRRPLTAGLHMQVDNQSLT
ncbi:hypothetical protein K440DRAFT_636927 [Wilcoxina mikolae CBS 423.85]|nr:hypothetical protein K440DRAFT_636927 [Wilcoxina mikolae CBS 423.85]